MKNLNRSALYTIAAASLTGLASNATGAVWGLSANSAGDSLAHLITIRNDAAVDHSAKTAVITGTDANGNAQTETLNLPGVSATVTSTKYFLTVTSVVPSATIGADTMDIGWSAVAVSPWVKHDYLPQQFSVAVAIEVGGTINYDVQHCYSNPTGASVAFNHSSIAAKTANADGGYTLPVQATRVHVNSHTSGTFTYTTIQGNNP